MKLTKLEASEIASRWQTDKLMVKSRNYNKTSWITELKLLENVDRSTCYRITDEHCMTVGYPVPRVLLPYTAGSNSTIQLTAAQQRAKQ